MCHFKALMFAIKYEIDTKYYFYQMKPDVNLNGPWELCVYSDADYSGDNYTRKIMTGYIVIVDVVAIDWHFQSHKTGTLYVTKV